MEERKKVIYIAGPITGVDKYWEAFERVEDDLSALGYIPLSPAHLPSGMTNDQYTRIDTAMLDSADAVVFLPGYEDSKGAMLELQRCKYVGKPHIFYVTETKKASIYGMIIHVFHLTRDESRQLLKRNLEEVLNT